MAKRTTLAAVAERTGLSRTSVAYILNGGPAHITFSAETRTMVETAARDLGYRPSVAARATATGRTSCMALLHAGAVLHEDLLWSIHDRLAHHGLSLGLSRMPDPQVVDHEYVPRVLATWMADGLLITADRELPAAVTKAIASARIPALVVGLHQAQDAVHADDDGAGRDVTQHLLCLGHRRIAFIDHDPQSPAEIARHGGYNAALRVAGLRPRILGGADVAALAAMLTRSDRPSAVICAQAPTLVLAAARMAKVSVPGDLSVLTFAAQPWREPDLEVATHIVPWSIIGRTAVDQVQARLGDAERHLPALAVPGHLVVGTSLAAPTPGDRAR